MKTLSQWLLSLTATLFIASCTHTPSPQELASMERQIIDLWVDSLDLCHPEVGGAALVEFITGTPATLSYDFEALTTEANVFVTTSDDGKLRLYSWDTYMGGTSPVFVAYAQINTGGEVVVEQYSDYNLSQVLGQVQNDAGETIYLIDRYGKASSAWGGNSVATAKIEGNHLTEANYLEEEVGFEYFIPDWYFMTAGLGWDWAPSFDKATETLYVPNAHDYKLVDRYFLYRNTGEQMECIGEDGGYWLHESVRDFKELCGIYVTSRRMARVDKMEDDSYRYATWRGGEEMSSEPELVIASGRYDEKTATYTFTNAGYTYRVKPEQRVLEVSHRKRVIQTEEILAPQ